MSARWIAFYAPMKPPDHPTPSGDRLIARLTLRALERAGLAPRAVSTLRTLDVQGDRAVQDRLAAAARQESARLVEALRPAPPAAWFTYHCHYKAPDLLGPAVTRALRLPYLISEPSISSRRRQGPWAAFAEAAEAALRAADRLLWTTERDRPALEEAGLGPRLVHLPAFLDLGPPVPPRPAHRPLRLLTVAMMRSGDKLTSYRRLAAALPLMRQPWQLRVIGDGPARADVEAALAPMAQRVTLSGAVDDPVAIRSAMEDADVLLWPGVGEGVGMVWLEAQAAGLPVAAEDGPAARETVAAALSPPDDPGALAATVEQLAADRPARSAEARAHVERRHGIDAAAALLGRVVAQLLPEGAPR